MKNDKWLTIDELAEYLKVSRTKLYRMAQNHEIPASKIGALWRFDREEIDAWVKNQRQGPPIPQRDETGHDGEGEE